MPSLVVQTWESSRKGKTKIIRSAFDSETFESHGSFHVEGLVGSATISPSGRDVALASPEGLAIIDLDSPYSRPRRLSSHGLPWLVVDVQWSPFAARDYWVASTANHRCLVWNLNLRDDSPTGAIEHSLQGHSRAITDINFSAHHPDLLATCSVDGYVHCWDLRRPRQPAVTFCDWFAGATQVKFNRQDSFTLASSHDRWLHVWDERKPSEPVKSITAHTSKIYGIDWHRTCSKTLATCSLDKRIKLWNYDSADAPVSVIKTDFPVWRARFTPFGRGLLAMPQNEPGNLHLYDCGLNAEGAMHNHSHPVKVFEGHGEDHKAKEFLWRTRGGIAEDGTDQREFQLVTWGDDNALRLQPMEPDVLEAVGYIKGTYPQHKFNITRKGATYKTFRAVDDSSTKERGSSKMSDSRPGSRNSQYRRSALTIGMQTMSSRHPWSGSAPSWKGPAMKAKSSAAKGADRGRDQLGWMKGITMSKKKPIPLPRSPQRKESKDSTMFSPNFHDHHWGEPETIQDEILRVNQQLPNVQWDNVDMEELTLKASLQGPWGANGDTIYIKVKVDIPHGYPKAKAPRFIVEKTALMDDQTFRKVDHEVNSLAGQFARRHQNCLEVGFSYLLGETDLSNSDAFFKNVKDLDDDDMDGLADDSSSEEDEDVPVEGVTSLSQDLTASVELDTALTLVNRTPVPRTCGARFANDGTLVCFFPTKEEKARAMYLSAPSEAAKDRSRNEPQFAGFGRLAQEFAPSRSRLMNDEISATDDQSDSDETDASSSSSSDSETTYMHKINMWYLPGRRFRKTFSGTYSMHSSGGGTGVGTGTGTGTSRRRFGKSKNVIALHNIAGELPSQKEFAREYRIFGDGEEVCEHNALVVQKYGRPDLVDVWKYAALLLRKAIPLEWIEASQMHDSMLVIAKDAVSRFGTEGSSPNEWEKNKLTGRVKWGQHPLAKDLITDLFVYFEMKADIQMLAMLSCIFGESSKEDSLAYAESHLTQPETPLPMKAPAFSLDYFPADASLWVTNSNYKSQATSAAGTPKIAHTPTRIVGSYGSDGAPWSTEPNSYSCGETPPSRTPGEGEPTHSLSTSPENRLFRRANTALSTASGFAANFPRPFSNAISSSPPTRKRPSPGDNLLANMNVTWGSSTVIGPSPAFEPSSTAHNSISDDESRKDDLLPYVCYGISAELEDQTIFDDDGWLSVPFLEHSREHLYAGYRYAYAEMLLMWEQPLARLEIMKFNVLKQDVSIHSSSSSFGTSGRGDFHESIQSGESLNHISHNHLETSSPLVLRRKEMLEAIVASEVGIDVTGICWRHEIHLDPVRHTETYATAGGAVGTCERCKRTQTQLLCVFCHEPITALYPPCLGCGCASHDCCLAEWYAAGETECPAGDDCDCMEEACNSTVESWTVMIGALRQGKTRKASDDLGSLHLEGTPTAAAGAAVGMRRTSLANPSVLEWESVADGSQIPAADGQGKPIDDYGGSGDGDSSLQVPMPAGYAGKQQPLSAARISLGNRLKKSAGAWGSHGNLRKKTASSSTLSGKR